MEDNQEQRLKLSHGKECPSCLKQRPEYTGILLVRTGRFGKFLGCSNFPACHFMADLKTGEQSTSTLAETT